MEKCVHYRFLLSFGSHKLLWTATIMVMALRTNMATAQEDLMAMESDATLSMVEVPAAPRLDDGSLAPEHRAQTLPRYNVRRQFDGSPHANGKDLPPPRNAIMPLQSLGQQIGEYMRRIGDYVYWMVSGNPPVTLRRGNGRVRQPSQSLFKRNFFVKKKNRPFRRQRPNKNFAKRTQQVAFLEHRPIDPKDFKDWKQN